VGRKQKGKGDGGRIEGSLPEVRERGWFPDHVRVSKDVVELVDIEPVSFVCDYVKQKGFLVRAVRSKYQKMVEF